MSDTPPSGFDASPQVTLSFTLDVTMVRRVLLPLARGGVSIGPGETCREVVVAFGAAAANDGPSAPALA